MMSNTYDSDNAATTSVADVLREFYELQPRLPVSSCGMRPLDKETLEALRRVQGYTAPDHFAGQLAATIRALWVARTSGELRDDDLDSSLWILSEVASLLEHAASAHSEAMHWQAESDKALATAQQKKPTQRRRKAKEAAA